MSTSVLTSHAALQKWIDDTAALCTPERIVLCDGSQDEWGQGRYGSQGGYGGQQQGGMHRSGGGQQG